MTTIVQQAFPEGVNASAQPDFVFDRDWQVFVSHVNDCQSFRSIAENFGISPTRVRQIVDRVHRVIDGHPGDGVVRMGKKPKAVETERVTIPAQARWALVNARIHPSSTNVMTDDELLALDGIGPVSLALIRKQYPVEGDD